MEVLGLKIYESQNFFNDVDRLRNRIDRTKERINKPEYRKIEIIQSEEVRK